MGDNFKMKAGSLFAGIGEVRKKGLMMISERHSEAARQNLKKALECRAKKRILRTCLNCKVNFFLAKSLIEKGGGKTCSWACRKEYMKGNNAPNSNGGKWMRGSGNPNWKNGASTERKKDWKRDAGAQSKWRRQVFYRDKYTCTMCRYSPIESNFLRAHHVRPWATYPALRIDISNGRTLCRICHDFYHEFSG